MPPAPLTVDVSNAITSLVLWRGDEPALTWRLATDPRRTADELGALLARLRARDGLRAEAVGAVVLACVVPSAARATVAALERTFGAPVVEVGPGLRTGLRIRTDDPREVGPDRVANAVAAVARHGTPVLVLDFATALTIDVVDADGAYRGALIAPGLEAAVEALASRTARLGEVELVAPKRAIADDTVSALQAGAVLGYAGLVEGLVADVRAEIGPARVVATGEGGAAEAVLPHVAVVDAFDPLLTHHGLREILALQAAPSNA